MPTSPFRRSRRTGATAVETAMVLIPCFMFIFSVFEYGRMLMAWNVLNNAAREGCRYALVNNTSTTVTADTTTAVTSRMSGLNTTAFTSFSVSVSGTHGGVSTAVNNLVAGDLITVTVTGTYQFMNIIPNVKMGTVTMTSAPTMVCEGAT
jgi:Flp pilus assembly protein TadG